MDTQVIIIIILICFLLYLVTQYHVTYQPEITVIEQIPRKNYFLIKSPRIKRKPKIKRKRNPFYRKPRNDKDILINHIDNYREGVEYIYGMKPTRKGQFFDNL